MSIVLVWRGGEVYPLHTMLRLGEPLPIHLIFVLCPAIGSLKKVFWIVQDGAGHWSFSRVEVPSLLFPHL